MKSCARCGSYAINPELHGRTPGDRLDLCDVCYWRTKAEVAENLALYRLYCVNVAQTKIAQLKERIRSLKQARRQRELAPEERYEIRHLDEI